MICQHCDNEVADNVEYCPYCGTKLTPLESDRSGRSFFGGKRRIKLPSPQEEKSVSDNNNSQRGQNGLNNKIDSKTILLGALVLLLLINAILLIGLRTKNNAGESSDTGNSMIPFASLGDTSASAATDSTAVDSEAQESAQEAADAAATEVQEPAQEAADAAATEAQEPAQEAAGAAASEAQEPTQEAAGAHDTDSQPIPADADSNEKEQGAPVITCDVHDLVLQVGESREVLISLGGSNLPGSRSITVTSLQGIVDWEWEDWVDGSSVKAIVTGLIEGDVQLELYFSDGDDKSEEPTKLASTYLHVKVIPNENNASSN